MRRYGGTVKYTVDGVMAIFGAPIAFEDHAFRACMAALEIQKETQRLAVDVQRRDDVALRLRWGRRSTPKPALKSAPTRIESRILSTR
jgi:class 3 adenylate cyclase